LERFLRAVCKKIIDDFAILEIKVLLQSTEMTIQGIADKLGFPDQSYFKNGEVIDNLLGGISRHATADTRQVFGGDTELSKYSI